MLEKILLKCATGTTILGEYKNNRTKLEVMCVNGHSRFITPGKLLSRGDKAMCKYCGTATEHTEKNAEIFYEKAALLGLEVLGVYTNNHTRVLARNSKCNHEYEVNPNSLTSSKNSGVICRVCEPVNQKDLIQHQLKQDLKEKATEDKQQLKELAIDAKLNTLHLQRTSEFLGMAKPLQIQYTCGHFKTLNPTNLFCNGTNAICRVCFPVKVSSSELEILEFIKTQYTGWIEVSDRKILEGKELDIVLPDLGIAIEFNGVYYHSDKFKSTKYHLEKTQAVEAFGYKLIHVFETEWKTKPDIVKSRLRSLLGTTTRVYARNTVVRAIPYPATFLIANHLQGAGSITKYNYGLFLKDELIAAMTFSTPRFTTHYNHELVRYCSKLNTTVVGGASKLLKAFRKADESIVSYSDRRWSQGGLYKTLGFCYHHTSVPGYKYYKNNVVYSRYQTQKHLLEALFPEFFNPELTELQIMSLAGFHKVFDCGNDVWVL